MTSNILRQEVLKSFKKLHRTSLSVFQNNNTVKEAARKEINEAYKKNKHVVEEESIKNLIKQAKEVAYELRTTVAEVEETRPGVYRLKLRPEMFEDPDPEIIKSIKNRKNQSKVNCCSKPET